MTDMSKVIVAKSDQLNADDLISGPRTITIRDVAIRPGEQPVSIAYEGDNGKPYKCCKSMARVMVAAWGADAKNYIGRSLTLYRDPKVKWAGMEVGGIRISHMSNIERDMVMALTETKGSKKPFTVKPLKESARKAEAPGADGARASEPQAATQAVKPSAEQAKAPALVPVPQLPDGRGSDWIGWLRLIGAAIDGAPTVEWLNGLAAENQASIGGLRDVSEKQYSALMAKLDGRRKAVEGEIPFE